MELSIDKVKKFKCPACGEIMEYDLPIDLPSYRDGDVQNFKCKCGLRYTIWGLKVTDLQKEYDAVWELRKQFIKERKLFI